MRATAKLAPGLRKRPPLRGCILGDAKATPQPNAIPRHDIDDLPRVPGSIAKHGELTG